MIVSHVCATSTGYTVFIIYCNIENKSARGGWNPNIFIPYTWNSVHLVTSKINSAFKKPWILFNHLCKSDTCAWWLRLNSFIVDLSLTKAKSKDLKKEHTPKKKKEKEGKSSKYELMRKKVGSGFQGWENGDVVLGGLCQLEGGTWWFFFSCLSHLNGLFEPEKVQRL